MTDWKSRAGMTRAEMMKVAGAILGLLAGCVLLLWVITRMLPRGEVPPASVNPKPKPTPAPTPRSGQ